MNMNDRWLSFVIPLYNCEKYIGICLDSILQQGLEEKEYEVLVINDGSIDQGASVVEEYCHRHPNFRLINKENGGVASARNRGIEESKGTYIHFMDADDRLLPNGMKTLRDDYLIKGKRPDMILFWSHTVDKYYNKKVWGHIRPHQMIFRGTFLDYGKKYGFGWNVWSRIISHQFLTKNNIRFSQYTIGEDVLFMMDVFAITDATIVATNLNIYRYCVREDSALNRNSKKHVEKVFYDYIDLYGKVKQEQSESKYPKQLFEPELSHFRCAAFVRLLSTSFSCKETKAMLIRAKLAGFYPFEEAVTHTMKAINLLVKHPFLCYLSSIPCRYLYRYVKPLVRRN